ncbi:MAG: carboxylesterase family protein, partial [Verrucomicrobiales bacterium]
MSTASNSRKLAMIFLAFGGSVFAVDFKRSTGDKLYDDGQGQTLPYRLFKPQEFCADTSPLFRPKSCDPDLQFPLVIYFHGAGERGTDNKFQANGGGHMEPLYQATQGATFDGLYQAFLLAPQCPTSDQWVNRNWTEGSYTQAEEPPISRPMESVLAILDNIIANYPVDTNRIYVTGLSMGGFGTWDALSRRPKQFAAAMPLSGGGNRDQGTLFKDIPIWTYHGSSDGVVPVSGADDMRDAIEAAGGSIEYTRIATGHTGWSTFYNNTTYGNSADQKVYEWLFSLSLTSTPTDDYDQWASAFLDPTTIAAEADPDGDGMTNREEYAFGLDPTLKTSAHPMIRILQATDNSTFLYTRRDPTLTALVYTVSVSSDLQQWQTAIEPDITRGEPDPET